MSIEVLEAMYALDTKAYDLYEKGIQTTLGWTGEDKVLLTVTPNSDGLLHLPVQMLIGINSMYEYYEYTGKTEFLELVYPYVKEYLDLWQVGDSGLVYNSVSYPLWKWGDSTENLDYEAIENACYYLALNRLNQMANILEYKEDEQDFSMRLADLKENFAKLWTEKGYQTSNSSVIDERANAVAVISGLADTDKYDAITSLLTNSYDATTYMEYYVLEALCKMGKIEEAEKRIKYRYDEMVNGEKACSTLWENWNPDTGTKNHAWAGGPLIILSKYFAGIEPLQQGYEVISIKPRFGKLTKLESEVSTIKGNIMLQAEKEEDCTTMKIKVPSKTRVAIPRVSKNSEIRVNRRVIYKNGKERKNKKAEYDVQDEEYIYFYVEAGEYEFKSK